MKRSKFMDISCLIPSRKRDAKSRARYHFQILLKRSIEISAKNIFPPTFGPVPKISVALKYTKTLIYTSIFFFHPTIVYLDH